METLFNKDRLTEVNPYLFQKIQNRIHQKENGSVAIPIWSLNVLRLSLACLVLLFGLNIFNSFGGDTTPTNQDISENSFYNQFVKDYHFDALSSLYPIELLNEE